MLEPDATRIHESAHAWAAETLGLKCHEVFATPRGDLAGGCRFAFDDDPDDATEAEARLVTFLAGQEAERLADPRLFGEMFMVGSGPDDDMATDLSHRLARLRGGTRFEHRRDGERKARELVERHWSEITALAGSLEWAGDRLTGTDLSEALKAAALGCRYRRREDGPLFGGGTPRWPMPASWTSAITFTEDQIEAMVGAGPAFAGRFLQSHPSFATPAAFSLWAGPLKAFWRAATTGPSMASPSQNGLSMAQVRSAVRAELRAAKEEAGRV
jgi:hypothetical protein